MKNSLIIFLVVVLAASLAVTSCGRRGELGTAKNPIEVSFMPSKDHDFMVKNAETLGKFLEKFSGYTVKADVSKKYVDIIDGLKSKNIDVAFLNSSGYLLAREWANASAVLQLKGSDGKSSYKTAIITNTGSGINSLKDLEGKTFAFTDPYSMAGYIMPLEMLKDAGVKPSKTVYAGNYKQVVEDVYKGTLDAGAIFYHDRNPDGRINDARIFLVDEYPDTLDKVKVIALSAPIPNTPVVFRRDFPEDIKKKLISAFEEIGKSAEALLALKNLYDATGFVPANQQEFTNIHKVLQKLGKNAEEVVPGALTFYRTHVWENVPEYQ